MRLLVVVMLVSLLAGCMDGFGSEDTDSGHQSDPTLPPEPPVSREPSSATTSTTATTAPPSSGAPAGFPSDYFPIASDFPGGWKLKDDPDGLEEEMGTRDNPGRVSEERSGDAEEVWISVWEPASEDTDVLTFIARYASAAQAKAEADEAACDEVEYGVHAMHHGVVTVMSFEGPDGVSKDIIDGVVGRTGGIRGVC